MPSPLLIRQGGLRFWWDRDHHVSVRRPDGALVDELMVPMGTYADGATLDEVHEAIDEYVAAREAS